MNTINVFKRLLADISFQTGVFTDSPDDLEVQWLLSGAPALHKEMLAWLETYGHRELPCKSTTELTLAPEFPEWLTPLWERFVLTDDPKYLQAIVQILAFCYKIEYEPTNEQIEKAQESYRQNEADLEVWETGFNPDSGYFYRYARNIVSRIIHSANFSEIEPSHGPGSVYPSRLPRDKGFFQTDYEPITSVYPISEFFAGLPSSWDDLLVLRSGYMEESLRVIIAKLTYVPKDSRGPRTICVHPAEAIWIQQGVRRELERCITKVAGRFIAFKDQTVNQTLARTSSLDRRYATIDLKDASDRLHKNLVTYLFGEYSSQFLNCCRASHVKLSDCEIMTLRKWAPMGNCCMFPVESLVFYALVRAGIRSALGSRKADEAEVYVFGDDIIVQSEHYDIAIRSLVRSGLIPNTQKCFSKGFFRESCGCDAYKGVVITPLRLKNVNVSTAAGAVALCDLAKRARLARFRYLSSYIYSRVRKEWGVLPLSNNPDAQGIVEYVHWDLTKLLLHGEGQIRFNPNLHRWEVRVRLLRARKDPRPLDDWHHLQENLLRIGGAVSERSAEYPVPKQERLVLGWSELL